MFFEDAVTTEFNFLGNPDSKKVETLLEERLQGPDSLREVVLVRSSTINVDTPAYQEFVTGIDISTAYQPIVIAFVLGLSFLLLMVVFRSIVIPAKAIVLNLLSVGAAYGLLVLVFQKGVGNGIFGSLNPT